MLSVNINEIKELINIITQNKIEEFELERAGIKIRIKSHISPHDQNQVLEQAKPSQESEVIVEKAAESVALKEEVKPKSREEYLELEYITSPIVGTFFRAANPNASSFCEIGDRIKAGQVLCIIEAMKLMNEIVADREGEITEIFPKNGQAVEYGEKLFALKPA